MVAISDSPRGPVALSHLAPLVHSRVSGHNVASSIPETVNLVPSDNVAYQTCFQAANAIAERKPTVSFPTVWGAAVSEWPTTRPELLITRKSAPLIGLPSASAGRKRVGDSVANVESWSAYISN